MRARAVVLSLGVSLVAGLSPATTGLALADAPSGEPARAAASGTVPVTEEEARARAKASGEPVEVVALRSESSEVYATPEGDLEAREYLRPVWTRLNGGWEAVDTGLRTTDGGVAPKASTVGLVFSGGGEEAPLVRMTRAGRSMSLSWPTTLPKPVLSGAVATYPSVLPDVDLRMTAQEDGFTQLLVVKSAEAAHSPALEELRMKLAGEGLELKKSTEGGLTAVDRGSGGAVFEAPKPMMWDSSPGMPPEGAARARAPEASSQEPGAGESGKLAPVAVEVGADQDELVLTPDEDVLKGEDTAYPVFIDPQWSSPRATAWTMASDYWASSPQWKFNGASDAGMGYCNWMTCNPGDTKRLFYRMPVSKFAGKSILSAEFVVRNTHSASCTKKDVELWETKGISSSTTWNTQKASGFWIKSSPRSRSPTATAAAVPRMRSSTSSRPCSRRPTARTPP